MPWRIARRVELGSSMRAVTWGAVLAALVVAGCSQGAPGKDVAAIVAGEKITVAELDRELAGMNPAAAKDPAARRALLEVIVVRKLLAKAARAENLNKRPDALVAKRIADETFDANLDRLNTIAKTAPPTPAEVQAYIADHPEMFAQRTGYLIEQLQVPRRHTPDLFEALQPTKTLEEVEVVLKARNLPYRRVVLPMDTLRADPRISEAVAKLPAGEPFVIPSGAGFTVNRVRQSQVSPVTGRRAEVVAAERLRGERVTKALRERLTTLYKEQVVLGPDFAPKVAAAK
jgi:peptidyl-prolyl cis-trans isomerase C